ncbi:MAG: 4Fe-4S dicluster domain-containing protein [Planctomycetota bacterium]|jgi:Fe-S-cluster-containing dehydrogenase component/formate-dependent nitrite reductase membrane component NrfD
MRYGFVIDNRVCIGCHACTVACKAEHLVPIGVNRTWVKYIEKGEFPNVSRNFQVSRCNHCVDAPCVTICPTTALFSRQDGIVDFDNRRCIGCKSCTQACPYDAIYIDPNTHTAAKCNFCAHRIDQNLNPSCVNICPEQAIQFGDLDDPQSHVAGLVTQHNAAQRKPEKSTLPSVFYIDGDTASLNPAATAMPDGTLWSDQSRGVGHNVGVDGDKPDLLGIVRKAQATRQTADEQPVLDGLLRDLQTATGSSKVRRAYDQPDKGIQWGWEVAAYIMTKATAAGLALLPALVFALPMLGVKSNFLIKGSSLTGVTLPLISLVFLGITGALLVKDLDQPKRFLYVMLRPQWKSWLVRGAYIVTVHGGLTTLWLANGLVLKNMQLFELLAWPLVITSLACAGYTALLFGQAKGRDFWQSPALLLHMLNHAPLAGFGVLALIGRPVASLLGVFVLINLALISAEIWGKHPNEDSAATAHDIAYGRSKSLFWVGVLLIGHLLPLLFLFVTNAPVAAALGMFTGMAITEYLWVYIPQKRPNV